MASSVNIRITALSRSGGATVTKLFGQTASFTRTHECLLETATGTSDSQTESRVQDKQNLTTQTMYVWRNTEVRSCSHCCSGTAISITYCVYVCSVRYRACACMLGTQLYNIFPHYLITTRFSKKKSYWTQNVCFDFLYTFCLKHCSF
jgi:hypothetical protein